MQKLKDILLVVRWQDFLDIVIVAILIYYLLLLIKESRALQMLKGIAVLLLATFLSHIFEFNTLNWILKGLWAAGLVAFVILFQPEIRQALIELGKSRLFGHFLREDIELFSTITEAVKNMIRKKIGALIVLERNTSLKAFIDTGTPVDSKVSEELLVTIFTPKSPLHDGAVIIKEGRIVSAGCVLPLAQDENINRELGMRHRAALGITEETDAIAIVVSEEFRTISLSIAGKITPSIDTDTLEEMLTLYGQKPEK